ncbi:Crp/Fnr family transcriptional regulator [Clostridiaceae bacterium HSG29]|nr:Crp/Fnr family transcriptional regulator [Clostridiaceae bacterium HSG29]
MKEYYYTLKKCPLFKNVDLKSLDEIFNNINYQMKTFNLNENIYWENDICDEINIILEGEISIQSISSSGEIFRVLHFTKGNIFGEGLIFSDLNEYPISVTASEKNTKILIISKNDLIKAFSINTELTTSFMKILSNRITLLNDKVKILALQSIRKKICYFILKRYKKNENLKIDIGMNKKTLAESLAIPRPSLSRELIKMKEEKIIDYDKKYIYILNMNAIELELYN